ncbi:MAG: cytochrome c family protein, partial [Sandaracinaceae bacterium]|nr:cytochrome c family protein [Sandaracinaceae bacterium]
MLKTRLGLRGLVVTSLVALGVATPASAQIFQPGSQPVGSMFARALTVPIQTNSGCARCHGGYADDGDYEPSDSWRGSMMANAERDPVARAALAIAEADVPGAADFCVRCHSPFTWYNGGSTRPEYDTDTGTPRFAPDDATTMSADLDGVACMSCHRSEDPGDAQIRNTQLVLQDGQVRYGPYEYTDGTDPRHETAVSTFVSSSRLCGQCHDIFNPIASGYTMDDTGRAVPTGRPFSIERTFSEWAFSRYAEAGPDARTCQDCHMPIVDRPVLAAAELEVLRSSMNRHDLAGGSVWQPLAILAALPGTFPTDLADAYRGTSDRARRMLESAATLEVRSSSLTGGMASATVRVTNDTGHKLPTGYPEGRRMWLEIDVLDATDRVVASSGHYDDVTDTLVADAQARIYDVELGVREPDDMVTSSFHFVLNDTLMHDTRIPPAGFDAPVDEDMAPLGRDYDNGDGTLRHWDETSYAFADLCGTGTLRLRARLRYQSNRREYMEFLRDNAPAAALPELAGRSWGDVAYEAWRTHGGDEPIDMESVEVELGAAPRACAEPDAGIDGGPASDAGPSADDAA